MIFIAAAGSMALAALFSSKWQKAAHLLKVAVLLLATISGGFMAQTAHLGGQIHHTEIGSAVTLQNGDEKESDGSQKKEKDDD